MCGISKHWRWPIIITLFFGLLSMAPYFIQTFHPKYQGVAVIRDKDFANYYARLERALTGHPEEAANGITPVGSHIEGLQTAGMEQIVALLFGWTGLAAPNLSIFVTGILTIISFLLLYQLLLTLDVPERWALGAAAAVFIAMFHVVTRVMHPGWSLPFFTGSLIVALTFVRKSTIVTAIVSGVLVGVLPYIYFWGWTFTWASIACLIALDVIAYRRQSVVARHPLQLALAGIIAIAISAPFFLHTLKLQATPLYPELAIRASFLPQRTPESWPRTMLLLVLTLTFLSLFRKFKQQPGYLAVAALLVGITLAMHQNVVHNQVFMFSSHYYPFLVIATLAAGVWVITHRIPLVQRVIVSVLSAVFLLAAGYDYSAGNRFFIPFDNRFDQQHLKGAITLLDNGQRDVVLSDYHTGRFVTAWTDDGIIYTTHARFLLLSDADVAERYCVTEMFSPDMPDPQRTLYIEYNRILDSREMRVRERQLVTEACTRVRANPQEYIQKYGVTHVLWDRTVRPKWNIDAKKFSLKEMGSGSGWTVWKRE